ncbi:MAG TPA: M24 family metallopeptidase [Gemmatimonadales bacterium]|nr:M24 family metallopeptidase [Gemmatimonadales bacterium]
MPPLDGLDLAGVQRALTTMGADGWLLFDFHGLNPIAARVVNVRGLGTRRYFVWLPRSGAPVVVAHKIELTPFTGFPGDVRPYAAWRELHEALRTLLQGKVAAIETSGDDNVPYLDRIPHGVVQLLERCGARVVSSAPLVTQFAARWTPDELVGHRRAAEAIADVAREALRWAGQQVATGVAVRETTVQRRVREAFDRAGLYTDHGPIVGAQANAADPHYEPQPGSDLAIGKDQVLLLDLWAGPSRGSVFADQTWMGFTGTNPPAEVRNVWETVRGARDAAVDLLRTRWASKASVTGADLDDAARGVIAGAGYGAHFVHRTGHSIDRDLHGSGPHLDNFETSDDRVLMAGIGFSVEPGIYLTGRFGVRSEINVFLGETGPEVTPRAPQRDLFLV